MLKELRDHCKGFGLTIKVNDKKVINSNTCYMIVKRYSKDQVIVDKHGNKLNSLTLQSAYECMQSGYFSSLE